MVGPDPRTTARLLTEAKDSSVHIFSAARSVPIVWAAFQRALRADVRVGILSETFDWRGLAGAARLVRGWIDRQRQEPRVGFVLAMGKLGIRWFRKIGYPEEKLYPFGYFVEKPGIVGTVRLDRDDYSDGTVNLVFIGQCVHRKGGDILLGALSTLKDLNWRLTIIGDGPERANLLALADQNGISTRVSFLGSVENDKAMALLERGDLLILPSRMDGWGAVANESLMRGIPVICSSSCGVADLLGAPERGDVFPSGSTEALRQLLAARIAQGKRREETSQRIRQWSACIEGPPAADYLLRVLDASGSGAPRPTPPWLVPDGETAP